jgi:hypothetical protein
MLKMVKRFTKRVLSTIVRRAPMSVARTIFDVALFKLSRAGALPQVQLDAIIASMTATGDNFVTLEQWPKCGAATAFPLVDPIAPPTPGEIGVILQGPLALEDNFTVECVRYYRTHFPELKVVVSTWVGQPSGPLAECERLGAEVVVSQTPAKPGRTHLNYQTASTVAGLRAAARAGVRYAAKTRTDQRVYAIHRMFSLPAFLRCFPVPSDTGQIGRLIVTSYGTRKYLPFFMSDFFMFGEVADLIEYWSATPDELDLSREALADHAYKCTNPWDVGVYAAERYLIQDYLTRKGQTIDPANALAQWWDTLARRFVVIDWAYLTIYWPKYFPQTATAYRDTTVVGLSPRFVPMGFSDWVELYTNREASRPPVLETLQVGMNTPQPYSRWAQALAAAGRTPIASADT